MILALAQIASAPGDISQNLPKHLHFVQHAAEKGAEGIFFPELSLSAYAPEYVEDCALKLDDQRFEILQKASHDLKIIIGIGLPLQVDLGIQIVMLVFYPNSQKQIIAKQFLHPDEEIFSFAGKNESNIIDAEKRIGVAICYEISIDQHCHALEQQGMDIYLASVAKTELGLQTAYDQLSQTAKAYKKPVCMVNCIGYCEGKEGGGRSAIWDEKGKIVGQLEKSEGVLFYDTHLKK